MHSFLRMDINLIESRIKQKVIEQVEITRLYLQQHSQPIQSLDELTDEILIGLIPLDKPGFYALRKQSDKTYYARVTSAMEISPDTEIWERLHPNYREVLLEGAIFRISPFSPPRLKGDYQNLPVNLYKITSPDLIKRIDATLSNPTKHSVKYVNEVIQD